MKKILLILLVLLLTTPALANPAGLIPYACIHDEAYVLLAFDPARGRLGYGAFGGRQDGGESLAETATREFREETRCAFDRPTAEDLALLSPSMDHDYAAFVAKVPFLAAKEIPGSACEAWIERSDWLWVRLLDLHEALDAGDERPRVLVSLEFRYIDLWELSAASLRGVIRDGLLPLGGLCKQ